MPGLPAGHEYHFVEIEQVGHLAGGNQVAVVDGVERPTHDSQSTPMHDWPAYWSILPQFRSRQLPASLSEQPLIRQHDWLFLSLCVIILVSFRVRSRSSPTGRDWVSRPSPVTPRRAAWPTGDTRGQCGAMPASVSTVLVDTSVAVAPVVADHDHHEDTFQALRGRTLGLAGHAAFERRTLATVAKLLAHTFPATRFLGAGAAMSLLPELAPAEIAGGAV